jgi:hypothetical protein
MYNKTDSEGLSYSYYLTKYGINDITRNSYSYKDCSLLDFNHILLSTNHYINKLENERSVMQH